MIGDSNLRRRLIEEQLRESAALKEQILSECLEDILRAVEVIIQRLHHDGRIFLCGNGGSAADCQHLAAELVGRLRKDREPLPAIALTTDTSILTSLANDYTFDITFARQIEALGREGDVLIAISTSGNSENVLQAVKKAREMGLVTIGLLGSGGGKLREWVDFPIVVPSRNTQRIQEGHITIGHILCDLIEKALFP